MGGEVSKERRSRHWIATAFLIVIVCVVVAAILEGGARYFLSRHQYAPADPNVSEGVPLKAHDLSDLDKVHAPGPGLCWVLKPDLQDYHVRGRCWARDVDFRLSSNSEGMRGNPLHPAGTRKRILAIGDSTTFGLGVNDPETWPAQLEKILNEHARGEVFEVLNAGYAGTSAFQGLTYLDKKGLSFEPACVLVCFGHNDFDTWFDKTDIERAKELQASSAGQTENSPSDFFVLARLAAKQAEYAVGRFTSSKRPRLTPDEFRDTLLEMDKLCKVRGIPVAYVVWPYESQVTGHDGSPVQYQPLIHEAAKLSGAPLINLYDAFVTKSEPLYADPVHGNAAGCRAAAEAIAPVVEEMLREEE